MRNGNCCPSAQSADFGTRSISFLAPFKACYSVLWSDEDQRRWPCAFSTRQPFWSNLIVLGSANTSAAMCTQVVHRTAYVNRDVKYEERILIGFQIKTVISMSAGQIKGLSEAMRRNRGREKRQGKGVWEKIDHDKPWAENFGHATRPPSHWAK